MFCFIYVIRQHSEYELGLTLSYHHKQLSVCVTDWAAAMFVFSYIS